MSRRKIRQASHLRTLAHGRALHVVDAENLLGTGHITTLSVHRQRQFISHYVPFGEHDHTLIAASIQGLLALKAWGSGRPCFRLGPNGADLALIAALDDDTVDRFDSVIFYSGDGIFADRAAMLATRDITTIAVSQPDRLSNQLRLACHHVIEIPAVHPQAPDAVA